MAGFNSLAEMHSAERLRTDWYRQLFGMSSNAVPGVWYAQLGVGSGMTAIQLGPGAEKAWNPANRLSVLGSGNGRASINHGGSVSPAKKFIFEASLTTADNSTVAPCTWMLVDLLGFYPISTMTTTGWQTLTNSSTFTVDAGTDIATVTWDIRAGTAFRLTNSGGSLPGGTDTSTIYYWRRLSSTTGYFCTTLDEAVSGTSFVDITDTGTGTHTLTMTLDDRCPAPGSGVKAFFTPSTTLGSGSGHPLGIEYVNAAGMTRDGGTATTQISPAPGTITTSQESSIDGRIGPWLPQAQGMIGDSELLRVTRFYQQNSYITGVGNVCLCRPLLQLSVSTYGVTIENTYVNIPSLSRVFDNACLVWLMTSSKTTSATMAYYGHLVFGWG